MEQLKTKKVFKKSTSGARTEYYPYDDTIEAWKDYRAGKITLSDIFTIDVDPFTRILGYTTVEEEKEVDPEEAFMRAIDTRTSEEVDRLSRFLDHSGNSIPKKGVVELTQIVRKKASDAALGLHEVLAGFGHVETLDLTPVTMGQLIMKFDKDAGSSSLFVAALKFFENDPEIRIIEQERDEKLRHLRETLVDSLKDGKPGRAINIIQEIDRIEKECEERIKARNEEAQEILAKLNENESTVSLVQPCKFEVQRTYVQGSYLSLQDIEDGKRKRVRKTKLGEGADVDENKEGAEVADDTTP